MKKDKSILFILHIPPPIHGSSVVGKFINHSKLVNEIFKCRYINLGTSESIDEIGRNPLKKVFRYLGVLLEEIKQLIINRPQLCYIAIVSKDIGFYKDAPVVLLAKLFGVRTIIHFHNKGVKTRQHRFFDNLLYRLVFYGSRAILLSEHLYTDVKKYFSPGRVYYCPNGLPEKEYRKDKKSPGEPVQLLFLSNLIRSKGVFELLEACNVLKKKGLHFRCLYVGGIADVSEGEFLKRINNMELNEYVEYAGKKYGEEKDAILAATDIFVHPTYEDCMPLVLIEAMQHALPIVSTFEGAIPEMVEDGITGFLVPQRDIDSLDNRLMLLIKDPLLRIKMGEAGYKKYKAEFTLEAFEERFVGIMKDNLE